MAGKMKPEIKAKLVAALRSGEYKQAKGALHPNGKRNGGFCCLGVLCDIFRKETGIGKWTDDGSRLSTFVIGNHEYKTRVPGHTVELWAFEESANYFVNYKDVDESLMNLNDEGISFNIIADLIEEQL